MGAEKVWDEFREGFKEMGFDLVRPEWKFVLMKDGQFVAGFKNMGEANECLWEQKSLLADRELIIIGGPENE